MALDARHRSSIYDKLLPLLGEEDCNAFMSQYLEAEQAVTRDFLRAELAELESRLMVRLIGAMAVFSAVLGLLISVD